MTTFADANEPPVLKAVQESDIEYKQTFKFNNSAIFATNTGMSGFNSMFWIMGNKSFEDFFKHFAIASPKSLTLTREVLREREQLETLVPGLQEQIKAGTDKLNEIKQEQQVLQQHEAEIKSNKNFEYEVKVNKHEKIPLNGVYTTNCTECCYTCHRNCVYSDDDDKVHCSSMDGDGNCKVCPDHCRWDVHKNTPYYYKYCDEVIVVKRTHENLKARYFSAKSKKSKLENMISTSENILALVRSQLLKLVERASQSRKRLEEIALKPNPLSEIDYLSLLIEREKEEHKPGWEHRIATYENLRRHAEILKNIPLCPISDIKTSDESWWSSWGIY